MAKPLISVIIPAYNEENYISECLESVVNQDFPKDKYEIIVVDNNSTDKTQEVIKKNFPKVRIVEEEKQGVVFARIKGVKTAKGEIIAFIDADSIAPQNWLSCLYRVYNNPKTVAVGGLYQLPGNSLSNKFSGLIGDTFYSTLKIIPMTNFSFSKCAYLQCGGLSPKINIAEEAFLTQKLRKTGRVILLKNNRVITSDRRLFNDRVLFDIKYLASLISLSVFKKPIFFHFKPIRDRGFLDKIYEE